MTNRYLSWEIHVFKLLGLRQVLNTRYNREWLAQCARGTGVRIQLSRRFKTSLVQDLRLQGRNRVRMVITGSLKILYDDLGSEQI